VFETAEDFYKHFRSILQRVALTGWLHNRERGTVSPFFDGVLQPVEIRWEHTPEEAP